MSLVVARLGLALLPFRTLRGWAERGPWLTSRDDVTDPQRAAELVEAAARHHLLGTTCLTRALVLCTLLRRRGHNARLVVGCARPEGRFEAHAWVACGSQAVTAAGPVDRFETLLGGIPHFSGGVEPQVAPRLIEYGSITKLTQGSATVGSDAAAGFKNMACL